MNQKVGINVAATADTSQVEAAINALGQKIAQANRVQYSPIGPQSVEDVKKLNAALNEMVRVQEGLRRRLKATGQQATPITQWDWGRMYPHAASRGTAMQGAFEGVFGNRFAPQPGGPAGPGSPGAPPPRGPGAPGGSGGGAPGGGGLPGMAAQTAQAGLRAMGPMGGVAAGALGTGMSAGFGAGLAGLIGGVVALGVGKFVGAAMENIDKAERNSTDYDILKRVLGDVNVSFSTLKGVVTGSADQLKITYSEAGRLGTQFAKLSNLSGEQAKTIGDELEVGVGTSRAFGLDPAQGVGVMGQMRGLGVTQNTQDSRRFALLIGETIGKSDAFAKSGDVMEAIAGFASSQTRSSMNAANVAGYAGMYSAMLGSKQPGMDAEGTAGLLNKINANLTAGGGKGEASQFFTGIVGHRMGLDPFQTQVMRENGAFATNNQSFGDRSAYSRYMGGSGPGGNATFLSETRKEIERQYPGSSADAKKNRAMAFANHATGGNLGQAMSILNLQPHEMGEMQDFAGDLTKMNSSGIANLSKARYGSAAERGALRNEYLGRKGSDAISAGDRDALNGAGSDSDLKRVLSNIALKYDQEQTAGSYARDSKNLLDNVKVALADKLVPLTQDIRAGILYMAGAGSKKTGDEVLKDIEGMESEGRRRSIKNRFDSDVQTLAKKTEDEVGALKPGPVVNEKWWQDADKKRRSGNWSPDDQKQLDQATAAHQARQQAANSPETMKAIKELREKNLADRIELQKREKAELDGEIVYTQKKLQAIDDRAKAALELTAREAKLTVGVGGAGPLGVAPGGAGAYDPLRSGGATSEAMTDFMRKGWTKSQAAGIVSNLWHESKLNGGAVGDGGQAYGIAQWHPDRQANFKRWSGKDIRESTEAEQRSFVHYELTEGTERAAGDRLKGAKSASDAGSIVSRYYERPMDAHGRKAAVRASMAESLAGTSAESMGLGAGGAASGGQSSAASPQLSGEMSVKLELSPAASRLLKAPQAPLSGQFGAVTPFGMGGGAPAPAW